jgi:hypothetical protein
MGGRVGLTMGCLKRSDPQTSNVFVGLKRSYPRASHSLQPIAANPPIKYDTSMKDLAKLLSIEDPVKRKALFIALFSREIVQRGGNAPIIVGGEAVEIYTQGSYTTGDIDIKSPLELTEVVLKEWGFIRVGRPWLNKELDIYVDWLGSSLEEGEEAEKRVAIIQVTEDLNIRVVSLEDLIIDRLGAFKWWGDTDSLMWAKVLIRVKKSIAGLDVAYIRERAKKIDLLDILEEILLPGE